MTNSEPMPGLFAILTSAEKNVGTVGGDLPSRIVVTILLITLTALAIPALNIPFSALKIASLASAQLGAVFLMTGLFFSRKTYFAGITLIPAPLLIMWLTGLELPWFAVSVGILFIVEAIVNILTRRCGINRILRINSCHD